MKRTYGWTPDLPDHRDFTFALTLLPPAKPLPPSVDLRKLCPPVLDQGQLGSCTANAIANAYAFDYKRQPHATGPGTIQPSRLFIYYNERAMEGTIKFDAGAQIRDGIKSIAKQGVCDEEVWPYLISKFRTRPMKLAYVDGLRHQAVNYARVPQTRDAMRQTLAAGFPVVFGFTVYEAFESGQVADTGVLNLPAPSEKSMGGHAVLCVGYDDKTERFLVMNSWGSSWGQSGYFTMPYAYLLDANLADDLWTVRSVE